MKFFKLQNSEFRQVFKVMRIDWCSLMSGDRTSRGFLKGLIDSIKEKVPMIFQRCPYMGLYEIVNASMDKKFLSIYPLGTFRTDMNITNEVGKRIVTASLTIEISN